MGKPKITVIHIFGNKQADVYEAHIQEDKITARDDNTPNFDVTDVIDMKLPFNILPKRRRTVIFRDGKIDCVKFIPNVEAEFSPITKKDRKQAVNRLVSNALSKLKPLSNTAILILGAIGVANLILLLMLVFGR